MFLFDAALATAMTTINTKYYEVSGNTTKQLHDAITINSPNGAAGFTEFSTGKQKLEVTETEDGKFLFKSVTIEQNIVITLPEWSDRSQAKECAVEQWDSAMTALKKHEENHGRMYQQLESKLNISALKIPPQQTRKELYDRVQQLLHEIFNEIQQQQNDYDRRTNFGEKEGVRLTDC